MRSITITDQVTGKIITVKPGEHVLVAWDTAKAGEGTRFWHEDLVEFVAASGDTSGFER